MSQQAPASSPSIPGSPVPGKDPPVSTQTPPPQNRHQHQQPGGEDFDRDGDVDRLVVEENKQKQGVGVLPNPRRTSYRTASNDEASLPPPQSPGIILTQPTFEFRGLGEGGDGVGQFENGNGSQTHSNEGLDKDKEAGREGNRDGNIQHSLLGEGLAGTEGTVKGLGIGIGNTNEVQRPNFAPFFTLVNDVGSVGGGSAVGGPSGTADSGKMFHPQRVHYIFADDEENGVLTEALVRCVEVGSGGNELEDDGGVGKGKGKSDGGASKEREERVVIVDINETGDGIKGVWSANPNWAVLSAEIGNAPTWDGTDGEEEKEGMGGMMLRIEGVGVGCDLGGGGSGGGGVDTRREGEAKESVGVSGSGNRDGSGTVGEDEMQALLEGFDRKMAVLRRIVATGEEFKRVKSGEEGGGSSGGRGGSAAGGDTEV